MESRSPLARIRFLIALFAAGLILSGVTAFPLLHELRMLAWLTGPSAPIPVPAGLSQWIARVHQALEYEHAHAPFLAYGTDWLAFGHLIIALFFIGPMLDPVRNIWCLYAGLIACACVLPLALICGSARGIPLLWSLLDCSFGLFGSIPLWLAVRWTRQLSAGAK